MSDKAVGVSLHARKLFSRSYIFDCWVGCNYRIFIVRNMDMQKAF